MLRIRFCSGDLVSLEIRVRVKRKISGCGFSKNYFEVGEIKVRRVVLWFIGFRI